MSRIAASDTAITRAVAPVISLVIALAISLGAWAETVVKPALEMSTIVKTGAIVESVNYETRELKLLDAEGKRYTITAGEQVVNLDQIKPRDRIITEYIESVAVMIAPPGSEPLMGDAAAVAAAPEGSKPGVTTLETKLIQGTIESINAADRLVTVSLETGEVRTIQASNDARLDLVEVGDQVRLRITQAMDISVVQPED